MEQDEQDYRSSKIKDLEIPFYFVRKKGQGSIYIRIEGDDREQCEKILNSIEIIGQVEKYNLMRLDRYPKEYSIVIVIDSD